MSYLVKKKVGVTIFKPTKIYGLSLILIVITIGMSILYSHTLVRYIVLLVLVSIIVWKRQIILDALDIKKLGKG